jgi:single-stranded-DNA-specific exonuclease
MQKRWLVSNPIPEEEIKTLSNTLKVNTAVSEILLQRKISNFTEAENFFRPNIEILHDPLRMKGMGLAVSRLEQALEKQEKVMLYGDYDVDGTCSVAMMYTYFKKKLENLSFYIPDRYEEGYGVSQKGMEEAQSKGVQLIITLDCGIKNVAELNWAIDKGIDVIVCDHHEPGEEIPNAIILNPKQKDCAYPFKDLCGCGVGFKLLQAFQEKRKENKEEVLALLDFVAVAIGADLVSVLDENRILAFEGLKRFNQKTRKSFEKLLEIAGKTKPLTLTDIVFTIAPRINAAGRINVGSDAVTLMISEDEDEINQFAESINNHNTERRALDEVVTREALAILELNGDTDTRRSTVVHKEGWSKGVVGIVASRLIEKHFKPTIVLAEGDDGLLTGSARTVNDFDIHDSLIQCADLLVKFGGHTHAAGLTLEKGKVEEFKTRFEVVVSERLQVEDLSPTENVDLEINFSDIFNEGESLMSIPRLKRVLDQLEPHGPGNMKPVFLSTNVYAVATRVLKEQHLKLTLVQPPSELQLEAIGFNLADKMDFVASGIPVDIIYTLEGNTWKDKTTLQLNIKDIRETI